ncbi:PP2C family serine/threonine-protein phosphatase [Kibdelosporangium persicum]|uniref:Serine/threonine-protein phosphatase n=1 Tax=Kibdelosporangium persicum TaxID=2698649 RepID=A0ABX2EZ67_9PSEU|nr:protein phosphatase 2C domain-containing protein [Kibdelosporangium persicum]NRN64007.1 Serine/threonine-protein phosphatase [Kibdelosporangium persicum]
MTLVLRYAARSDRGLVRSNNQDSVYAGPRLLALADGLGGHAAGEVASKVVVGALAPLDDDTPGEDLLGPLRDATVAGNNAISELVTSDPELDGMGTTLTAMLFAGNRIGLVHVGDSRAYMRRGDQFSQITHDDTFVQSLIDEGRITAEEASSHPQRSLLLRALTGHDVEPSLTVREARAGDRYLLCSDGLSSVVSYETLAEAIQIPDPQACADRMIELALKGGGPDNITVIVADVVDVDYGDDDPIVGGAAGDGREDPPPPDSSASRAAAMTAAAQPRPEPRKLDQPEPEDPKAKGRKRLKIAALVLAVLVLVVGGVFTIRYFVLRNYYVGEGTAQFKGEIAIFQGVPGSVLGIPLQREVQGSCDPALAKCNKRYVDQLDETGKATVLGGSNTYGSLNEAREFINRLRTENVLDPCPDVIAQQQQQNQSATSTPPTDPANPEMASTMPSSSPRPGVDCRPEHNEGGGG